MIHFGEFRPYEITKDVFFLGVIIRGLGIHVITVAHVVGIVWIFVIKFIKL